MHLKSLFFKRKNLASLCIFTLSLFYGARIYSQKRPKSLGTSRIAHYTDYDNAKPWVLWYWMDASVSEAGIRADLIAMKQQGIAGAYLVCVRGKPDSLLISPPVVQLTPLWWQMLKKAFSIADSLGLKLGMHVGDGFATSGGPWITPALSMQRVVWSDTTVKGNGNEKIIKLPAAKNIRQGYYKDIAVYAFTALSGTDSSTDNIIPVVTTNAPGQDGTKLITPGNKENFSSKKSCWIDYAFKKPFTCRSIEIITKGITFQAKRLKIYISDNGKEYRYYTELVPARSGWQDYTYPVHYSIPAVTSKYFRFVYDPEGTEPGSEDLDDAKWSPSLKLTGLKLSCQARIDHFEGKSGAIWRIAKRTDASQIPDSSCIKTSQLINITKYLQADGTLHWKAPRGKWTIVRMGHSSTGMINATAGGGKGLECDKFNPVAIKLQFDSWFGKAIKKLGPHLSTSVLKVFYMDSWECGSQNWSPVFRNAFIKRRGYDPLKYLPVMAGYPVGSARQSEQFLHDVRQTIADLLKENYFGTICDLAHQKGYKVTAECTAPIMVGDGLSHFDKVDFPMGEFWLSSPTHDKPNDILDAISGGHIYGKNIIQAEAFTELRNKWNEYPGMLKTLQDHHYALGINRLVFHVFGENPWLNRAPGMTLGGVGLYFQRDQTWWPMAHGWLDYTRRAQSILQHGTPVTDIAVFNGEEIPSRAVLPDRLLNTLPGLFGVYRILVEKSRLENKGNPLQHIPEKVTSSAGITTAKDWIDPLHGYKYDAINRDALLRLARVQGDHLVLPGGAAYRLLVLPRLDKMDPNPAYMSLAVAKKLLTLTKAGATLLADRYPQFLEGLSANKDAQEDSLHLIIQELLGSEVFFNAHKDQGFVRKVGSGRVFYGAYTNTDLSALGIQRDFKASDYKTGEYAKGIAWNHRRIIKEPTLVPKRQPANKDDNIEAANIDGPDLNALGATDLYFVSNQLDSVRDIQITLRAGNKIPMLYDAVTGHFKAVRWWKTDENKTRLTIELPQNGSVFIFLRDLKKEEIKVANKVRQTYAATGRDQQALDPAEQLTGPWQVKFDPERGGPKAPVTFKTLQDWTSLDADSIKNYSGIATYRIHFKWTSKEGTNKDANDYEVLLALGKVHDIASIRLNNIDLGVAWTYPYQVDITKALKAGDNFLEIQVANTWANRILSDEQLPKSKRQTWSTSPFNLQGHQLLTAGLIGPVRLMVNKGNANPSLKGKPASMEEK